MPNPTVLMDKLRILTDAAKYDVACTSSGLDRKGQAGGLGSAVASALAKTHPAPVEMVGVQDEFGEVGTVDYLQNRFGLTAAAIVSAAERAIARK